MKSVIKRILGLSYTPTQLIELNHSVHITSSVSTDQSTDLGQGVRLSRVPFFVFHVFIYALVFLLLQIISSWVFTRTGAAFDLSQLSFVTIILIMSLIMFPVHIRRAHDIGWSMRHVLAWSIVPAFLRLCCLLVPLIIFINKDWTQSLFGLMPFIGIVYWGLMQIQLAFLVLLFFAPGTGVHNRYGSYIARAFTLDNLYGIKIWHKKDTKKAL